MDPGINKLVAVEIFYGRIVDDQGEGHASYESESVRFAMTSSGEFYGTGTAGLVNTANKEWAGRVCILEQLSHDHGKTMATEDYKKFGVEFKALEPLLLENNMNRDRRRSVHHAQRKRQSYYSDFVNTLFAVCEQLCGDAPMLKMPVIVFGSAKIRALRGHRAPNSMWLRRYLSNSFLVLLINEHNTSQKCPECFGQAKPREKREWTMKRCTTCKRGSNNEFDFLYDRDYGATKNMMSTALALLRFGKRPAPFQRP